MRDGRLTFGLATNDGMRLASVIGRTACRRGPRRIDMSQDLGDAKLRTWRAARRASSDHIA
jgi:hypothetical protein